jgi:hypothetical protein
MSEPKTVKIKAIDVKPYRYAVLCVWEKGEEPFVNEISLRKWSEDGEKIVFMLESFNFLSVRPDEELELVPIENPRTNIDEQDAETVSRRPEPTRKKPVAPSIW